MVVFTNEAKGMLNAKEIKQITALGEEMLSGNTVERITRIGSHDFQLRKQTKRSVTVHRFEESFEKHEKKIRGMTKRRRR